MTSVFTTFNQVVFFSCNCTEIKKKGRMYILRINNRRKTAISISTFISELGENFTDHIDKRLMELSSRCFLMRKESRYRVDLRHVEHLKYDCDCIFKGQNVKRQKEYSYGEFQVIEGELYFSDECVETSEITKSPQVSAIYDSLDSEGMITEETRNLKRVNDNNIDYIVDSIMEVCPETSQAYREIVKDMMDRASMK